MTPVYASAPPPGRWSCLSLSVWLWRLAALCARSGVVLFRACVVQVANGCMLVVVKPSHMESSSVWLRRHGASIVCFVCDIWVGLSFMSLGESVWYLPSGVGCW